MSTTTAFSSSGTALSQEGVSNARKAQRIGGFAALIHGVIVLSPLVLFGAIAQSAGFKTRADYADYKLVEANWVLGVAGGLVLLAWAFASILPAIALFERLKRINFPMMLFSLGMAFVGSMAAIMECVRSLVASVPMKLTDTPGTEQYEGVLRLMLNTVEPVFIMTMVVATGVATATWGLVALKGGNLPKGLVWLAIVAGILGPIVFPLYNFMFAVLYFWLGFTFLRSKDGKW